MATKAKITVLNPIENRHKCPIKIWKKFKDRQKIVYNNMRSHKPDHMTHPKMKITDEQWQTISHNFACMAAWEYSSEDYKIANA